MVISFGMITNIEFRTVDVNYLLPKVACCVFEVKRINPKPADASP